MSISKVKVDERHEKLKVAMAIAEDLERQNRENGEYVGATDILTNVTLDGHFDLVALAKAAIEAMREPTE